MDATATASPIPVETYEQLVAVLRGRIVELGIIFDAVDSVAGLPTRYASKVLSQPPMCGMTVHVLLCLAGALGLQLQLVRDASAVTRLRQRSDWTPMIRPGPRYRPRKRRRCRVRSI